MVVSWIAGTWTASAWAQPVAPPASSSGEPTPPKPPEAPPVEDEKKAAARAQYDKGLALFHRGAWAAALAELLESRRLFATRSATSVAAICLRNLERYDEALGMFEALLKDFPDLPGDMKAAAQRAVVELRELVGVVEVVAAPIGAGITIDGRSRGDYPSIEPLRVPLGSHSVRVYKEGFEPFEARVDVAGGKVARVTARLRALKREEIGRLQVVERSGKEVEVLVDGVVVGKTPRWEGPIAIGAHTVALRGEGELGTQPASVPVKLGQVTALSLSAEVLGASIQVTPTPAGANVAIDSVVVGRGIWEGRLRAGAHQLEVTAEGFLPETRQVTLERGEREVVVVSLERDQGAPTLRVTPKSAAVGVAYGVGALGLGTFAVTGIMALVQSDGIQSRCGGDQCPASEQENLDGAAALGTVSTVGLVVGGIGVAAGTILFFALPSGGSGQKTGAVGVGSPPAGGVAWKAGVGLERFEIEGRF